MDKIKVVFIDNQLLCGGAEQALFDLICLMDRDKFDVSVFSQFGGGTWDQKFRDAGIEVCYDYSCRQATWNPIRKMGNVIKKLRTINAYRHKGAGLLEVCYPQGADLVVSYSVWKNVETGFLKGAKSVKYIHGNLGTNPEYRDWVLKERDTLPRFDTIVCVSEESAASFREITGVTDRVEMHLNPLNSENVRRLSMENVDLPEDEPLVCAVGRLVHEKGFDRLLVIHKKLLEQGIRHKLVIVGDGPDRDYMDRVIQALDVQDTVIMAGYRENPYPYMSRSRFLVCSSYTEGLPVISMEALSLGIPVVSSVPSIGELFGGEDCGLVTGNDNDSLLAGMKQMLDDVSYRKYKAGAEKRKAFFDGKRMVQEVEDMFIRLAKS